MRKKRKKLCVDIIGPYVIWKKEQKENLNIKSFTMIDPVTGWFEIKNITIGEILLETTSLSRYPTRIKITYDQGK